MVTVGVYSFEAKTTSRGYHVYNETSWSKVSNEEEVEVELEKIQSFKKVDPYVCVVCAKEEYFKGWKTVGHILRELCRNVY